MKLHSHRCCHTLQDVQAHHRPDRCLRFGRLGPLRLRQLRRWQLRWCPSWLRRDQGSLNPKGPKGQGLNSNLRGLRQVSKLNSLSPSFKFEHGLSGIWPKPDWAPSLSHMPYFPLSFATNEKIILDLLFCEPWHESLVLQITPIWYRHNCVSSGRNLIFWLFLSMQS